MDIIILSTKISNEMPTQPVTREILNYTKIVSCYDIGVKVVDVKSVKGTTVVKYNANVSDLERE